MREVKIFDAKGNLKKIIPKKKVIATSYAKLKKYQGHMRRVVKFKKYFCAECKVEFKSNSTKGATYCKKCRAGAYKRSRRKSREKEKRNENLTIKKR